MRKVVFIISGVAAIAAGFLYWNSRGIKPGQFREFNIVLITVDTLRADHLPAYGYSGVKTPAIDRLAEESILFEDAVAHVPMTLPSHASVLTGLLPFSHGVRDNAGFILHSGVRTLSEILKEQGYTTAAFISSFVLDSQFGMDQGFDVYSDDFTLAEARVSSLDLYRRAADTQDEVHTWLEKRNQKNFFLWVHYYDPHDPYDPPEPYRSQYQNSLYDGEIAYTDEAVGRLMAWLDGSKFKENTIVIFTSDHGEGLGEHYEKTHSLFVYNSTQHVPLMFRIPGVKPGRLQQIAAHVDIVPTILDLLGIAISNMDGQSLVPDFNGESEARTAYSESYLSEFHYGWSPLKSITSAEYKFIEAPRPELYDRKTDRAELHNLAEQKPETIENFRRQLKDVLRLASPVVPSGIDSETEEKLRALGYVGSTIKSTEESRRIDPKDRIQILNAISKATSFIESKKFKDAIQILEPVLKQEPQIVDAHYISANAHLHLGNQDLAVRQFEEVIARKPDHTQSLYNLGYFYHTRGDLTAAEYWYKQVLKYEPDHLFGNLNLASLYRQRGENQKAQPYITKIMASYEKSLQSTSSAAVRSRLLEKMAEIHYKTGNVKKSEEVIRQALQLTPGRAMLHYHLGVIYQAQKKEDAARQEYSKALELANKDETLRRAVRNQLQSMR